MVYVKEAFYHPYYLHVYLDDISNILNTAGIGCNINSITSNHLFYADDSVLLAPSPDSLQKLIYICDKYAKQYELSFNVEKTKSMCFKPKGLSNLHVPPFVLDGKSIDIVSNHVISWCISR